MPRFFTDTRKNHINELVPLLVIGAGLPRSATSSIQAAFEQLGFAPCMHMADILPYPSRQQLLLDASREENAERRKKLLRNLTLGYVGLCNFPALFFFSDLLDMHPDATIVLNGRSSSEVWAVSSQKSFRFFFSPWFKMTGFLWKTDRLWYAQNMEVVKWAKRKFDIDDILHADSYNKFHEFILNEAKIREKDVLEFKPEDGWEPLCKFLEKDVPNSQFPRLNEKRAFAIVKTIFIMRGLLSWAFVIFGGWSMWKFGSRLLEMLRTPGA